MPALIRRAAFAALTLLSGCQALDSGEFHLAGTATLEAALEHRASRANTVLFVIAKNQGGVPIALRRYINPSFPLDFELGDEDLLLPGEPWGGLLRIEGHLNRHGDVGVAQTGDILGTAPRAVRNGDRSIRLNLDNLHWPKEAQRRARPKPKPEPEPEPEPESEAEPDEPESDGHGPLVVAPELIEASGMTPSTAAPAAVGLSTQTAKPSPAQATPSPAP